jgi:hypothetical protein
MNWQITLAFTIDTDEETAGALNDRLIAAAEGMGLNFEGGVVESWPVRKAKVGWWVDDRWCPTKAIRDHAVAKALA